MLEIMVFKFYNFFQLEKIQQRFILLFGMLKVYFKYCYFVKKNKFYNFSS